METISINQTEKNKSFNFQNGYAGQFGGAFVPPVLEPNLNKLAEAFRFYSKDPDFLQEFTYLLKHYTGRPSPLFFASNLSQRLNCRLYLKREDLNHTGSHKINNTIGQILLAKRMGAKEIIAETGAGQHGVATATAAALFGMKCKIFQGSKDAVRQEMNVRRIRLLGAELITTDRGTATLKDAVDAALEYFISNPDSFYLLGSQVGPHPYPEMVGFFQSVIGNEARKQILEAEEKLPDHLFACIGGGSNAIGLFSAFLEDEGVKMHAAEGGGEAPLIGKTAATLSFGRPAVFQGTFSYCLLDERDEPAPSRSIAAGLDYPGVSPMHSFLKDCGRVNYYPVSDEEAVIAFRLLSETEGIIPAIESAHALALAMKMLKDSSSLAIVNLSGRGDKDVARI
jgi:tryptophan synthase beta chain